MRAEFFNKFKFHGYKRNHNRKGYVFKKVGDIEFWARIELSTLHEGEWYPEFGISTESPYGKEVCPYGFMMYSNTVYLGELYLDSMGGMSDTWKDGEWEDLEKVVDNIILPWLEKFTDLQELAKHFRHRIENQINYIQSPQDKIHEASLPEAGKEILGLMGSAPEKSDKVGRFWQYLFSIYKSAGDFQNEKECALKYAKYETENSDLNHRLNQHLVTKIGYINEKYS